MQDYTYLLIILMTLCASGWLDDLLKTFRLRRDLCLFLFLSCLALQGIVPDISGVQIVPSTVLLVLSFAICSYVKNEFSFPVFVGCTIVFTVFLLSLLYLFPMLSIEIAVTLLAAVLGILQKSKPVFSVFLCVCIPFVAYTTTLFADFFYYFGDNLPTAYNVYLAQIAACIVSSATSYAARRIGSAKQQLLGQRN